MQWIGVDRLTRNETRFTPRMGRLDTQVTYIRKTLLGFPIKVLHKYRGTYYGAVKDCSDCNLEN